MLKKIEDNIDKKLLIKSGVYTLLIVFVLFFIIDYSLQINTKEPEKVKKEIISPNASEKNKTNNIKEPKEIIYKVKKGDSLYKIANKYDMTIPELKLMNRLEKNNLSIGQILKIKKNSLDMEKL